MVFMDVHGVRPWAPKTAWLSRLRTVIGSRCWLYEPAHAGGWSFDDQKSAGDHHN